VGKLDGKVAVITGGSSGMALAGAKLFVEQGAHVFISGRRHGALDEAVKLIDRNVTGVQADSANLDDLDRCSTRSSGKGAQSMCCGQVPGQRDVRSPSAAARTTLGDYSLVSLSGV
jgi:NAD(P)-dependent dehydrogenase (short-subunit alcohol dehydrogenase family)